MGTQFKGYPSKRIQMMTDPADIHVTAEPIREMQVGLSTLSHMFVTLKGNDAVEALSTSKKIIATAHAARPGDVISFTSGALDTREVKVGDVTANEILLAEDLEAVPAPGDTFDILRHLYPRLTANGNIQTTSSVIGFLRDGITADVFEDTVDPANNVPLPVKLTGVTGDVTINAGDLNVQLSHSAVNYDSVRIGDGTDLMAVNADGSLNAVVTSTNLDIRDLTHVSDSVQVGDGTDLLGVNADGSINVINTTPALDTQFIHRRDYAGGNVTTAAYAQLIASTTAAIRKLQVFDSSGQTMVLAIGGAGAEMDKAYIIPGGNGELECVIPAASRVSVKAVSANATLGELVINFIG